MALLQVNYMSKALLRTVTMNVILPVDKFTMDGNTCAERGPFRTLYLLHGLFGNYTDWISGTRIQRWAEEKDLAVVMPSGENGFYVDQEKNGNFYGEWIGRELVRVTRAMFPLSEQREDTYIGGLSMGGFGALRNGLKYHDTFSRIIALSSAVHIFEDPEHLHSRNVAYEESCFGDMKLAMHSDKNPRVIVRNLVEEQKQHAVLIPDIFMACGTEDSLLEFNRSYRDMFREAGINVTYYEGPGAHTWDFWDEQIRRALDWLPLGEDSSQGLNSGNVNA